jgi:LacI family transcriptional regulator
MVPPAMTASPRGKPNIGTVAAKAKVAPMTVSRVLNGGYASAAVRARVEHAIKELRYVPSATARSLKYGRKGCIGIAVESVQGAWFMGLLAGIEEELNRAHLSMMLGSWRAGKDYDPSAVTAWLDGRRLDGMILVRFTKQQQPLLDAAERAGLPVTFICPDRAVKTGFTVRCKNYDAGRAIAEHLIALGHRRLAFVGGPKDSVDTRDRLRGLRAVVAETRRATLSADDVRFQSSYMPHSGTVAAQAYLKRTAAQRPSAVVLGNDSLAIAFMRELLRSGVSVPHEVSVAGFDGIDEGERAFPALTTVAQPMHCLGAAACKALLDRIGAAKPEQGTTVEYPMQLLVRESTAPPAKQH